MKTTYVFQCTCGREGEIKFSDTTMKCPQCKCKLLIGNLTLKNKEGRKVNG